jgi:hypothetical protein
LLACHLLLHAPFEQYCKVHPERVELPDKDDMSLGFALCGGGKRLLSTTIHPSSPRPLGKDLLGRIRGNHDNTGASKEKQGSKSIGISISMNPLKR